MNLLSYSDPVCSRIVWPAQKENCKILLTWMCLDVLNTPTPHSNPPPVEMPDPIDQPAATKPGSVNKDTELTSSDATTTPSTISPGQLPAGSENAGTGARSVRPSKRKGFRPSDAKTARCVFVIIFTSVTILTVPRGVAEREWVRNNPEGTKKAFNEYFKNLSVEQRNVRMTLVGCNRPDIVRQELEALAKAEAPAEGKVLTRSILLRECADRGSSMFQRRGVPKNQPNPPNGPAGTLGLPQHPHRNSKHLTRIKFPSSGVSMLNFWSISCRSSIWIGKRQFPDDLRHVSNIL